MFNFRSRGGFGMLYQKGRKLLEAEAIDDLKAVAEKLETELRGLVGTGSPVRTSLGYNVEYDMKDDTFGAMTNGTKKKIDLVAGKYGGSAKIDQNGKLCVVLTTDRVKS